MKNLLLAAIMLLSGISLSAQTFEDSLFQDKSFRLLIGKLTYELAIDITSDTTAYAVSVRPFFDRFLTTPEGQRGYFIDMISRVVLYNPQSNINPNNIEGDVEFIVKTQGVWQIVVNAWTRQRNNQYLFPYDLDAILSRLEALENP